MANDMEYVMFYMSMHVEYTMSYMCALLLASFPGLPTLSVSLGTRLLYCIKSSEFRTIFKLHNS